MCSNNRQKPVGNRTDPVVNIPTFGYGFLWDFYGNLWDVYGFFTGCKNPVFHELWDFVEKNMGLNGKNMGFYGKDYGISQAFFNLEC